MADIHGSPGDAPQMPGAGAGPAPVPYSGADLSPEPPLYDVGAVAAADPGAGIMQGVSGNLVQESGYAHDLNAGLVTPYYGGDISPIDAAGDADAGGRDDVAATVAGSVDSAQARYHEHMSDTLAMGSTIGDLVTFPPSPLDPGAGVGNTAPSGGFYDPDRDYGGDQGAPGYQGDAQ